ncbi:MAG TPA: pyridoxal-dependent decarboxylase [Candidatus Limnocylindria bacterium]|nr:pyridoxal-dependent decarboxylase [Candidatus Limnocylindria bacterium]
MSDEVLRRAAELATEFLRELPNRHVGARADRSALMAAMSGPLPEDGEDPLTVIEALASAADPGVVAMAGPRYFGFVIGGSLPSTVAAEWLAAAWDQNAGIYTTSPAASVVEEVAGTWLLELLDLPATASVGFVTGGQMANFTCLAAARHAVLARAGWDVEADGLADAPPVTVIVGEEAHATALTALGYLGLGRERAVRVPTDEQGRLRIDGLAERLRTVRGPLIVCLQAGNVNTGAFDDAAAAIAAVRQHDDRAWVHVDGAFGLWARASSELRDRAAGLEGADSWAVDGHKWLNVPYDSGYAIVADPAAHVAALAPAAGAYIQYATAERDSFNYVPEYSRRARGFATWVAIRTLGRSGIAAMLERCCAIARRMADRLAAAEGVEVLNDVVLNQVLVRFHPPLGGDADAHTRSVVARVQADGTAWLAATTWHGMAAMRISVSNWSTTDADADLTVDNILRCAAPA